MGRAQELSDAASSTLRFCSLTCELLGGLWVLVRAHGGCS